MLLVAQRHAALAALVAQWFARVAARRDPLAFDDLLLAVALDERDVYVRDG